MIKIRYSDLPEGLHAKVEAQGRRTVIYLRPALAPAQRRGALRRVRRMAQIGNGPPLSASGVARAMAMDTARSTTRNGMAAVRCHPAGSLFLTALLASATVCYMLFVSVSIHLIPAPPARGALPAPVANGSARSQRHSGPRGTAGQGGQGGQPVNAPGPTSSPGGPTSGRTTSGSTASARAAASPVPSPVPSASASASPGAAGPVPSQLASSPVALPPAPAQSSSASPGPPGASPAPSAPGAGPGGLCVDVGPLGVCLSVQA